VKSTGAEVPPFTPNPADGFAGFVTVTGTGPAVCKSELGICAVNMVGETKVVARAEPFHRIWAPTTKLSVAGETGGVPFTVRVIGPLPFCALFGEREAIEGCGMGSLGPVTVVGLPEAIDRVTELSPDKVSGVVDRQDSVVVLHVFGLLLEVANRTRESPGERFAVETVKDNNVG